MCFGKEVDWKQWGSERLLPTFLTINEIGKWSNLKTSSITNEILEQELTLVQYPDSIYHDPKGGKQSTEEKQKKGNEKGREICTTHQRFGLSANPRILISTPKHKLQQ